MRKLIKKYGRMSLGILPLKISRKPSKSLRTAVINFNFENFTLFVNDKPTIPISYDWKLFRENIQCPIYDKNY
mgnify:CR=1 FL=1